MEALIAQVIGAFGLICLMVSVQQNKKRKVLFFQILANVFYLIQYIFLGGISAAIMSVVSITRSYVFYLYDKNNKPKSLPVLLSFIIVITLLGFLSFDSIFSILPILATMSYTYGVWQNDLRKFRIIAAVVAIFWLIYNAYIAAYIGVIASVIEFISAIVAIVRLDIRKK